MDRLVILPLDTWQDLLVTWLGSLREIVRIDCALRFPQPFGAACEDKAFRFPRNTSDIQTGTLIKLGEWMRFRKVYISQLTLSQADQPLPMQWEDLLSWSGERLQHLCISPYHPGQCKHHKESRRAFMWASCHLKRLQSVQVQHFYDMRSRAVAELLQNNASTLISLQLDDGFESGTANYFSSVKYPNLQVLRWKYWEPGSPCTLLQGCPSLVALSIATFCDRFTADMFAVALADSCPALRRLQIEELKDAKDSTWLTIARGCPLLEYLEYQNCYKTTALFADVVCALPCLRTLIIDKVDEAVLLEIAARGHTSLRVLNTNTYYTYAGLRQITAALPKLTGLAIHVNSSGKPYGTQLLQYCSNLNFFKVCVSNMPPETVDRLLQSITLYCAHLSTLIIYGLTAESSDALHAFVSRCAQVHRLHLVNCTGADIPTAARADFIVTTNTEAEPAMDAWMPDWA